MVKVLGALALQRALRQVARRQEAAIARGLKKAGLFLQRESQAIVPIDTGNLKGGAFTRAEGAGWFTIVTVGFTADYAVYVHEDLEARHAPGKEAKFLEKPLRQNREQIIRIIHDEARRL